MAVLLSVHAFLFVWAMVGFAEWFSAATKWPPVSNPLFPREILFMQWSLTLIAGAVFIGGRLLRWVHTPVLMASVYAAMATLCAVETFLFMTSESRFVAMGLEYLTYAAILVFLFRSSEFGRAGASMRGAVIRSE